MELEDKRTFSKTRCAASGSQWKLYSAATEELPLRSAPPIT